MDSILSLVLFLTGLILIGFFIYSQIEKRGKRAAPTLAYKSRQRLFTPTETAFLYALEKAVGDEFRIFGKVRLADIVDTEIYRGVRDRAFSLIAFKHVDFLLCDKRDLSIVCAVELDDWTHANEKRRTKDAEKEYALNSAGVPLARFAPVSGYALREIRGRIADKTIRFAETEIPPKLVCPQCGADRMTRLAKKGTRKGNFFIGCRNYPNCWFTEE